MRYGKPAPAILALLLLLLSTVLVEGQELPSLLRYGSQSIQFRISDYLGIGDFQGTGLSYQRFLNDRMALRAGFSFDSWSHDIEYTEGVSDYSSEYYGVGHESLETWNHAISGDLQVLFFFARDPLFLYWGAGPTLSYLDTRSDSASFFFEDDQLLEKRGANENREWQAGVSALIGIQVPIKGGFAILAEYSVRGIHFGAEEIVQYWREDHLEDSYLEQWKTQGWRVTADDVRMGLSVSF